VKVDAEEVKEVVESVQQELVRIHLFNSFAFLNSCLHRRRLTTLKSPRRPRKVSRSGVADVVEFLCILPTSVALKFVHEKYKK